MTSVPGRGRRRRRRPGRTGPPRRRACPRRRRRRYPRRPRRRPGSRRRVDAELVELRRAAGRPVPGRHLEARPGQVRGHRRAHRPETKERDPLVRHGTLRLGPRRRADAAQQIIGESWRARRDSNPRPLGPQPNALSTELRAHAMLRMAGGEGGIRTLGAGYPTNGLANRRTRPLCDLSVARRPAMLPRVSGPPGHADRARLTGRPSLEEGRPMTEPTSPPTLRGDTEEEIQAYSVGGAQAPRRADHARRLRPRVAGPVRPRGGPDPVDPRRSRRRDRAHRLDVGARASRPSRSSTSRSIVADVLRRAGVRPGPGGGRLPAL